MMYYAVLSATGNDEFIKLLEQSLKEYSTAITKVKKRAFIERFHYFFPSAKELNVHISISEYNCLHFFENLSSLFPTLDISLRLKEYHGYCREHFLWRSGELIYEHRYYANKTYYEEKEAFTNL